MTYLGIDFGTTTTVGAIASDTGIELLADEAGQVVFPSVVAYPPAGGCLIGNESKYRRAIDAENTLFSMKRILGLPWGHSVVQEFVEKYPFNIAPGGDNVPRFSVRAGKLDAAEVSSNLVAHILGAVRRRGLEPEVVVLGVPSDFTSHRRVAATEVVRRAGFDAAVCVDEPLAIARAFLREELGAPRRIAVYDLGGGTFDIAICEVRGDDCVLLAAGGDQFLGGDDIDLACCQHVALEVLHQFQWDILTSPEARTRLLAECERIKIQLGTMQTARVKLRAIENADHFVGKEITIERKQLDRWGFDLARRSFVVCDDVVARSGLTLGDIDQVFLAGGTTRMASVQRAVAHYFGREPTIAAAPDHLVAMGAAVIARELATATTSPEAVAGVERRHDLRRKTSLRVRVQFKDLAEFQTLFAHDISVGGTFVAMVNPPKPGAELLLRIEIAAEQTLELSARVVRRVLSSREAVSSGVGVEFNDLSPEDRAALEGLLARSAQLFGPARPRGAVGVTPAGVLEK